MAFVSLLFVYLAIILVIVCISTFFAIVLFIVSMVLKKQQLSKNKKAMAGDYGYQIKKTYMIPKVFGWICMIPLTLCIILIVYAMIATSIEQHTSLSYNVLHANVERVEKIIDRGASPDCTEDSNRVASDGEKTLLYLLAEGALYNQFNLENESREYIHSKTLDMIKLLIEKGANVNYVVYKEEENDVRHRYEDEYSVYNLTDQCGWTPLMMATYRADFDMIKLLVDNGADVNATDYCGFNVIDIVADYLDDERGYEILIYYLEKGVDPKHTTNFNQNAGWLAMRQQSGTNPLKNDKILMTLEQLYLDSPD